MERILVTGASGFIGGFIVDEALRRGMDVWAAVRKTSSRAWLSDQRIHFVELNLSSEEDLRKQLDGLTFDYVVHAAGVTKCLDRRDFYNINTEGTKNLVRALTATGMDIRLFVYISSLSVYGPIRERQPYTEITADDKPCPNTAYGESKLQAEIFLREYAKNVRLRYVVLRPTGVYGPRERDYFLMVKSIARHIDFAVGYTRQDITFVYVLDVVQAIFRAIDKSKTPEADKITGRGYFLSDGCVYSSTAFSDLIRHELGNPWCLRLTAPLWLLRAVTFFGERIGRMTGRMSALNDDKYNILKQRNWRCDISSAVNDLGYKPRYPLNEGVRLTIKWYKENGWVKR